MSNSTTGFRKQRQVGAEKGRRKLQMGELGGKRAAAAADQRRTIRVQIINLRGAKGENPAKASGSLASCVTRRRHDAGTAKQKMKTLKESICFLRLLTNIKSCYPPG